MGHRVGIDSEDLERLFACIQYVIGRYKDKDPTLVEYLEQELGEVTYHIDNEQKGADIVKEISAVMEFIGGDIEEEKK